MKILVPIKRVADYNAKIRVKADGSAVDLANIKMSINPFCEIAVEEAVRLKEAGIASEVVVVSLGGKACEEQLRTALALGADRAIRIDADAVTEPLNIAKCLLAVAKDEQAELVIFGKQSIDGDNNQTAQMFAALWGRPQATFASEVVINDGKATVTREVDGGLQKLRINLPAVISTDLRLNEPRFVKLPNIMKAKRKPLATTTPDELGVVFKQHTTLLKVAAPASRSAGIKVADVGELVDKLKNEARVI